MILFDRLYDLFYCVFMNDNVFIFVFSIYCGEWKRRRIMGSNFLIFLLKFSKHKNRIDKYIYIFIII